MAPGFLADLNVIDLDVLACAPPEITADLPAGGRRLLQAARGYRWTVKRGAVTFEDGVPTGALPGRLVRGSQRHPRRREGHDGPDVLSGIMGQARTSPDRSAVKDLDRELTYAALAERSTSWPAD